MNKKQLIIMWIAIVICVVMFFEPPRESARRNSPVNWSQLAAQWFLVGLVSTAAIYTVKDKPKNNEKE